MATPHHVRASRLQEMYVSVVTWGQHEVEERMDVLLSLKKMVQVGVGGEGRVGIGKMREGEKGGEKMREWGGG